MAYLFVFLRMVQSNCFKLLMIIIAQFEKLISNYFQYEYYDMKVCS